jgi:hypothetical protein
MEDLPGQRARKLALIVASAIGEFGLTALTEAIASFAAQEAARYYLEGNPGHTTGHAWGRVASRFADLASHLRKWPAFTK